MVRLACKRHLQDLKTGPKRGLRWDLPAALRTIRFFEKVLRLAEGEHAGQPFHLQLWQKFIIGSLFGWKAEDGYRRFRNAYIEIGKGNGKTPMAAGIGLYMLTADGEAGGQCYAAATSRDQAQLMFQDAVGMRDASPALAQRVQKSGTRKVFNLAHLASGSFFRPISSEHRSKDGFRVHYAGLDELHEHPNALVVDKMRAGTKGRRQALIAGITNSGYDRQSVCWQHHEYSEKILQGLLKNDAWFAYVCGLDPGDDFLRDEKCWLKANPNLGVSIPLKYLREQVAEAIGMPTKENIVRRLNGCEWTERGHRWLPLALWDACRGKMNTKELATFLEGERCFGGLDLALTRDLSALILIFPPSEKHSDWKVLPYFWCSEEDIRQRSLRDHVDYDVWERQGFITATPGNVADHDFIEAELKRLRGVYQVEEICYDRALAAQLVTHLTNEGCVMTEVAQGPTTMNAPIRTIEKLLLGKQLAHGGHPLLRWCFSNVVTRQDSNGNIKFDKEHAYERIDGMTAFATGMVRAIPAGEAASSYTDPEIMFL